MKKVKVKINGNWVETVAINGSTSGFSYQSWLNYVAVRNRTKTTIEAGDIDFSKFTGDYAGGYLFTFSTSLTSAVLNFNILQGASCLNSTFTGCSSLQTLTLNLATLNGTNPVTSAFTGCNALRNITIIGMSNQNIIWSSTNVNVNLFAQTVMSAVTSLTITVDILPNLYLAVMTSLNLASVVQVLGKLFNYSAGAAHTITFNRAFTGLSQSDYNLIDAAKTTANARNWTVAGLTYSL